MYENLNFLYENLYLVSAHYSALYVSFFAFLLRSDIPFSPFSPLFLRLDKGLLRLQGVAIPNMPV